jgi:hypothetical protein
MVRFLLPTVAAALTLALTGPAHAHGPSYPGGISHSYGSRTSWNGPSYAQHYGTPLGHGYSFSARNFYWSSRRWSSRYGFYSYWNPYVNSWYYWNPARSSYYPLSYLKGMPPTMAAPTPPRGSLPPAGPPVP